MIKYKVRKMPRPLKWLIKLSFPGIDLSEMYGAFGKVICEPDGNAITSDLVAHELVHIRQQRNSYIVAVVWWIRYRFSLKFRYSQELPAYRKQMEEIFKHVRDPNKKARVRNEVASIMTNNPAYKGMVTYQQAFEDLKM